MGATVVSNGSVIGFNEQQVIIHLDRKLFTPWHWALVTGLILHLQRLVAGVREEGAGLEGASWLGQLWHRPWRHSALDLLSQLLYLVLIPADHFLVRLDREVDLSFVDEECADCYQWQPGQPGRPPWPAQLMFRLHFRKLKLASDTYPAGPSERQLVPVVGRRSATLSGSGRVVATGGSAGKL